jgi:NitT/TauT family transport system substrate-binding protein
MKKHALLSSAIVLALMASTASAAEQIRILAPTWLGFAPVHIAQDLGCFTKQDLDVSIRFEDDLTNVMAAMERGDIEMQMRSVGEYQGRPRDKSTPGVIIGTIDESVGGDGVIADASISSVADLKGKTVAAEANIPSRLLLQMELKKAGLTLNDLQIKEIATADTGSVFADSSISAVATYEPFMSQAISAGVRDGAKILISSKDHRGLIIDAIIVRNDDLKAAPAKYGKFLECIYEAVDFIKAEPDKFAEMASKHFGLTPKEVLDIANGSLSYTSLAEAKDYMGAPGAPGTLFDIFATVMDLNLENGAADNRLVASEQIDNSVIAALNAKN